MDRLMVVSIVCAVVSGLCLLGQVLVRWGPW